MKGAPTLADVIAHDLAMKCADDVGAAIHRTFKLCDSQGACVIAAVAGAGTALANVGGALLAATGRKPDAEALDAIWRDIMRPLALTAIGDRTEFEAMLGIVSAKPERINGDPS